MEVNSQLFKAHYRNVVKDRAEILKHTTMLNGTLAAAWRIRHEIVKLEIARLPERNHRMAWSLVRRVYFQILGNRQLVDPIFNNLIKVAMENATFWENMQALEQSDSTIEGNYQSILCQLHYILHTPYAQTYIRVLLQVFHPCTTPYAPSGGAPMLRMTSTYMGPLRRRLHGGTYTLSVQWRRRK